MEANKVLVFGMKRKDALFLVQDFIMEGSILSIKRPEPYMVMTFLKPLKRSAREGRIQSQEVIGPRSGAGVFSSRAGMYFPCGLGPRQRVGHRK